jgi:adenine deaminase
MSQEKLRRLISVSRLQTPASTWIRGAQVLNVYTGEVLPLHVVLCEDRIAYVGEKEPLTDDDTRIIDGRGFTLVPGYIEPHVHSYQVYNPLTLGEYALARGTTTLLHDNLVFFLHLAERELEELLATFHRLPVKNYWWCRLDPQVAQPEMVALFTPERLKQILQHPLVLQAGELTFWKELIDGDMGMVARMWEARQSGKRIETHNPGASVETLNAVAAAGATGCHESINAEEVMRRLRLGYYATLRHSSIRPDLPDLIKGLLELDCQHWDRMMLTTDGSPPFFLAAGFLDACVRLAIEAGLSPALAYRLATLNPAVYYRLDQELGGIAPGRIADILFLEDLRNPTPVRVMANGRIVAENQVLQEPFPSIEWTRLGIGALPMLEPKVEPEWFEITAPGDAFPVMEMYNAVITRLRSESLPVRDGRVQLPQKPGYMYVSLLHRQGEWITTGVIKGFAELDALACTYTLSGDLVILGRDPVQMAQAANHVIANRGGICVWERGELVYDLPLPMFGTMSPLPMSHLIEESGRLFELLRRAGYLFADPIYSLLFLSATHLPKVRLTPQGICNTNDGQILLPARSLKK